MKPTLLVHILLPIIAVLAGTVDADNVDGTKPLGNLANCLDISDFDAEWFPTNACTRPQRSQCLFYGQGLGPSAKEYAKAHGLITIWDIWYYQWYRWDMTATNRMRCIMYDDRQRKLYFEWMSRGMATLCSGDILYMTKNPAAPDKGGFFKQFEYPTMQSHGLVTSYTAMSVDGTDRTPFSPDFKRRQSARDFRIQRFEGTHNTTGYEEFMDHTNRPAEQAERVVKRANGRVVPTGDCAATPIGAEDGAPAVFDVCGTYAIPW